MAESDKKVKFLRACHKKSIEYFDNSLNVLADIPDDAKKLLEENQRMKEWTKYLKYKFSFLVSDPKTRFEKIKNEMKREGEEYLEEFLPSWEEKEKEEQLAYKYRYTQLPKEVILNRWYWTARNWDASQFCDKCSKEVERLKVDILRSPEVRLKNIYKKLSDSYPKFTNKRDYISLEFENEYALTLIYRQALQNLTQAINEVYSYLSQAPLSPESLRGSMLEKCQEVLKRIDENLGIVRREEHKGMSGYIPFGRDFLSDLFTKLLRALYQEEFEETAIIQRFLLEIKKRFKCEVCDFLDVSEDEQRILWRIGTMNEEELSEKYRMLTEEEIRKEVRKSESYKRGEGISGSMLLLNNNDRNIWYHIGSNDVYADPRQSKEHRTVYETEMYLKLLEKNGKINNFWAFPIFKESKLKGIFRVVNKLTENGEKLQPSGWPYHDRVELSLIAQWFSRFLAAIELQVRERAEWITVFKRKREINKLIRKKLKLDNWMDEEKFKGLLRHLMGSVSKKQEEHGIGYSIIAAKIPNRENPLAYLSLYPYPFLKAELEDIEYPYRELDSYHGIVVPLRGAYIFNQRGEFQIIASLNYKDKEGVDTLKLLTKNFKNLLCLFLAPDTKVIRIYQKGKVAAELYLSEVGGEWNFRYPDEILKTIKSNAGDCDSRMPEFICEACLELSYKGFGTTIVLGEIQKENFEFKTTQPKKFREDNPLDFGIKLFVDLVKFEGATFLNKDGSMGEPNVIVDVKHDVWEEKRHGFKDLFPGKGARHHTAEKISIVAPQALLIVVSQNRTISIIKGGKLLGSF